MLIDITLWEKGNRLITFFKFTNLLLTHILRKFWHVHDSYYVVTNMVHMLEAAI